MSADVIVKELELLQLPLKIDRVPEEHLVQIFAPDRPDQSLDERVRRRGVRHRFDLLDLEDPQVREPSMKAEQWIVIRTDPDWRCLAGDGLIEHATRGHTVDAFPADTEADDSAAKHIDDNQDPMTAKEDRFASKQVHTPETVRGLGNESEPRGTRPAGMIFAVVLREDPTHDILVDLHAECMGNLLSNALIAESGVTELHFEDGRDDFLCRALRAGLAPGSSGGEQAPIFSIDQRLVESQQRRRLENRCELRDSSGTHEQRDQSEHESIHCGQGRGASTGTAADNQLVLQQQRLGNDGADATGPREPNQDNEQLHREKKHVAHRGGRLSETAVSTRVLELGAARYDQRIRTPQEATPEKCVASVDIAIPLLKPRRRATMHTVGLEKRLRPVVPFRGNRVGPFPGNRVVPFLGNQGGPFPGSRSAERDPGYAQFRIMRSEDTDTRACSESACLHFA